MIFKNKNRSHIRIGGSPICRTINQVFRFRFVIFLGILATLLWGLLRPSPPPDLFEQSDKYMHFLAIFGFSLSARFAFYTEAGWRVWSLLLLSAPGFEYLQHAVQPARVFSWEDVTANLYGVAGAILAWQLAGNRFLRLALPINAR